jgi:hypothetical protein
MYNFYLTVVFFQPLRTIVQFPSDSVEQVVPRASSLALIPSEGTLRVSLSHSSCFQRTFIFRFLAVSCTFLWVIQFGFDNILGFEVGVFCQIWGFFYLISRNLAILHYLI